MCRGAFSVVLEALPSLTCGVLTVLLSLEVWDQPCASPKNSTPEARTRDKALDFISNTGGPGVITDGCRRWLARRMRLLARPAVSVPSYELQSSAPFRARQSSRLALEQCSWDRPTRSRSCS